MFIFVDETGADRRDTLRKYAYSWRGKPAKSSKLLVRGKHVTAMALMSISGILDCRTVHVQLLVMFFMTLCRAVFSLT